MLGPFLIRFTRISVSALTSLLCHSLSIHLSLYSLSYTLLLAPLQPTRRSMFPTETQPSPAYSRTLLAAQARLSCSHVCLLTKSILTSRYARSNSPRRQAHATLAQPRAKSSSPTNRVSANSYPSFSRQSFFWFACWFSVLSRLSCFAFCVWFSTIWVEFSWWWFWFHFRLACVVL